MPTSKPVVLRLGRLLFAHDSWEKLAEIADIVTIPEETTREELIRRFSDPNDILSQVKVITRSADSVGQTGRFDKDIAAAVPDSLVAVCHTGVGYDQIDVKYFSERHIQVSNTPDVVTDATADTHVFLLLGAMRNFGSGIRNLLEHRNCVPARMATEFGHDPEGKTVGILGLGRIGRAIVSRLKPFGIKRFLYYSRHRLSSPELENGCEYVPLDQLLRESDIISINVPLSSETRHLIDREAISKMKPGAVIINTARGAVIDEAALVEALKSGKVSAAGLDVYEYEPEVTKELLELPQVVCLPHQGTHCVETRKDTEDYVVDNARHALLEGKVISIVPEIANEEWFKNL